MVFGNTNMTVPDLHYNGTEEALPSKCPGREDPTVFSPHSGLGVVTSRYLTLAAKMIKIDFHRDEQKQETMRSANIKRMHVHIP